MANTVIQLKYSLATATPASLNVAEAAYSFSSNKLFIGNNTNGVITIGGKYYTDLVDAATDANTASAIVKRDASGNFSATTITAALNGNAATATKWQTARNIGVSGDATGIVSVDGSANANIPLTLNNTGVSAGFYGSGTVVPVFNVAANGRILSVTNTNITLSSSLSIAGDSGTDTVTVGTDTLTFEGGDGITSTVTNNKASFAVDNTVVRTTGGTISGDLAVTGNLIVSGNTVTQDVENVRTEDPLIQLAANNAANTVDIGFFGSYTATGTKYTGLVRDATDGVYKLLVDGTEAPTTTVNTAAFTTGTIVANITGGTVSGLTADIAVADGGTGRGTFTTGAILVGAGTGALGELANVTVTKTTLATSNTLTDVTTDGYGRITAVTATPIAISATQVTSGTLPIARGGTNQTSFTNGQRIIFDGTSLLSQANVTTTVTGGLSTSNTITSLTTNAYGDITAYTGAAIAIAASQVTSGTLAVAQGGTGIASYAVGDLIYASGTTTLSKLADVATGNALISGGVGVAPSWGKIGLTTHVSGTLAVSNGGTGATTLTNNGVLLGQGTNAITAASSSTEGHVLTINASGVPTFAHLSGGTF